MPAPKHSLQRIAIPGMALVFALATAAAIAADGDAAETGAPEPGFLDLRAQQPISGDAAAGKGGSTVCSACHGAQGLATAPMFPDLAGQSATYLYVQLKSFHDGQRRDQVMAPLVAALDDDAMRDLAAYYASLPPEPRAGAAGESRGARLFQAGDPARGIPPCQACHGEAGEGPATVPGVAPVAPHPPWSTIPRLRGQSAVYVAKALRDFRDGERSRTSNARIMQGVARTLDDADIQAIADYLAAQ